MTTPINLPDPTISYDAVYSVEDIFEDLYIAGKMTAQEFGAFMMARRLFRRECEVLLAQIQARGGEEIIETIKTQQPRPE